MFKRFELHNHTIHSDGSISCGQLAEWMARDGVDAFALTDHNTISGHREMAAWLREHPGMPGCVYGMEYTTYYGHILCLNLREYVPWDSIDRHCPEKLFRACRAAGAVTGIAHPFSYGVPFQRGCRFDMTVTDFGDVDFIEVFNNPEPLRDCNGKGIEWWEALVLRGERLACTAGMDLHGLTSMAMCFATYLEGEPGGDPAAELEAAVRAGRTWVSRGMLVTWRRLGNRVRFELVDAGKPGYAGDKGSRYTLAIRSAKGERYWELPREGLERVMEEGMGARTVKLYLGEPALENLVCIAPVLRA